MNSTMKFSVLASGSTGNAVYIEAGSTKLLVDAGVGIRQLQAAFQEIAVSGSELQAVVVTHEHSDHIKGLAAVVRKWNVPIYMSVGTWSKVQQLWKEEEAVQARHIRSGTVFTLGELVIEPFAISHDAEEPLGFCFYHGEDKLALATDLGYVNDRVREVTRGANTFIVESNHDLEMLRSGTYPWHLKRRILGDKGHLSNDSASEFLGDVISEDTEQVYLAHLSKENNRPELAVQTVTKGLHDMLRGAEERMTINMTNPRQPTMLAAVRPSKFQVSAR